MKPPKTKSIAEMYSEYFADFGVGNDFWVRTLTQLRNNK